MQTITYTITDELGIHARPAGLLAKLALDYQSEIVVTARGEERANAKRVMALMGLSVVKGSEIKVMIEGTDEKEAAIAVEDFLKDNL